MRALRQTNHSSCQRRRGRQPASVARWLPRPWRGRQGLKGNPTGRHIPVTMRGRSVAVIQSENRLLPPTASFKTNAGDRLCPLSLTHAPTWLVASAGLQTLEKVSVLKVPQRPTFQSAGWPGLRVSPVVRSANAPERWVFMGNSKRWNRSEWGGLLSCGP